MIEHGPEIFSGKHYADEQPVVVERDELYRKVGTSRSRSTYSIKLGVDQLPIFGK